MIGIIILNYNTWQESLDCIDSINEFCDEEVKLYLVDNNSTLQPSSDQINSIYRKKNVELIKVKENRGYSAGNNVGIKKALEDNCSYIMICNSDIIFVDNTISKLFHYMRENKHVGIVGPQIYNKDNMFNPFYMICPLTATGKIKNMLLHTPVAVLFKNFEKSFIRKKELIVPMEVFGVSGCCFMVSRECAEYLYPLDERTFLYEEEYIIGAIMRKSPLSIHIIPDTKIIHAHGKSTGGMTKFTYGCLIESEQLYLKEYMKSNLLIRKLIYIIRKIMWLKYKK